MNLFWVVLRNTDNSHEQIILQPHLARSLASDMKDLLIEELLVVSCRVSLHSFSEGLEQGGTGCDSLNTK